MFFGDKNSRENEILKDKISKLELENTRLLDEIAILKEQISTAKDTQTNSDQNSLANTMIQGTKSSMLSI